MTQKYEYDTVSEALPAILSDLLDYGDDVGSRNGRVRELLNPQIVINEPYRREVLSIGRGANVFAQIAETMWVLSGRNDIEWLSAYLPRAVDYSDDGKVWRAGYGPRIRTYDGRIDQLAYVIDTLKRDPLSRQAVIAIWDARDDTKSGKDRACNTQLQFQSRHGLLHLTVTVRSNDVMWGWSGINAFEWSTLQEIVASLLGINVGPLVFNIGSLHLYEIHHAKAEKIGYDPIDYPIVRFNPDRIVTSLSEVDLLLERWFVWEEMCRTGKATLDLMSDWEEPLFKAWAAAIAYYWMRGDEWLEGLRGTALAVAIARTPTSVLPEPVQTSRSGPVGVGPATTLSETARAFYEFVTDLHAAKHASYGDSWKKRGEKLSILANMARKVDRIGVGDQFDSSADTWIDLMVYGIKYGCWLHGNDDGPENVNQFLGYLLSETEEIVGRDLVEWETQTVADDFNYYADNVDALSVGQKYEFILDLVKRVAPLARDMWLAEDNYKGADID